jgi:hypothetical protein
VSKDHEHLRLDMGRSDLDDALDHKVDASYEHNVPSAFPSHIPARREKGKKERADLPPRRKPLTATIRVNGTNLNGLFLFLYLGNGTFLQGAGSIPFRRATGGKEGGRYVGGESSWTSPPLALELEDVGRMAGR